MEKKYDIAVIGGGPGGYVAAVRAAQLGFKTVCIDRRSAFGGTCLNVGCIPSKTLLHATEIYDTLMKSERYGIDCQGVKANFLKMMQNKESVVKGLADSVAGLLKENKVETIQGEASLISPNILEVRGDSENSTLEVEKFILATGSEPIGLPFLPFDEERILSSTGALSLTKIPEKMVVIGAGAIGLELASVYQRLGTTVTIVEMLDLICPTMDKVVSQLLLKILKNQGLTFHLSTRVMSAEMGKQVRLFLKTGEGDKTLDADVVLVAIGRAPYTQGLGLDKAGVQISSKGFVDVDAMFRTNQPHIFAIGDLIEGPMLAHRASEEGTAVAEVIGGLHPTVNYMAIPNVIYTSPEVAAVGMTEQEAKAAGLTVKVGIASMKGNPRARCIDQTEGMVKVIAEASSGRLIGMHIVSANASEMIGEGVMAIEGKATISQIAQTPHAHPTLSESIKEAALRCH